MDTLKKYDILLKEIGAEKQDFIFLLKDCFFEQIDQSDIVGGNVHTTVTVMKQGGLYHLSFEMKGKINTHCHRCLDEVSLPIDYVDTLKVKLGDDFDQIEDIAVVPEVQGKVNVAWYMYELIALHTPIKRTHQQGECNKEMMEKLNNHTFDMKNLTDGVAKEETIDPRWAKLKNIKDNIKNQ